MTPRRNNSSEAVLRAKRDRKRKEMRELRRQWDELPADAPLIEFAFETGAPALVFECPSGPVALRQGTVSFINQPETDYDFTARVRIRERDGRRRAEITELVIKARDDGPAVTARGVQRSAVGRFGRAAIHQMTRDFDGLIPRRASGEGAVKLVNQVMQAPPTKGRAPVNPAEVEIAAGAYEAAQRKGVPTTEYVRSKLAQRFGSCSASVARKRVSAARKQGRLPSAGGTTRPRA